MENKELKENNIDNKYGIEYTKVGDYYMPNLVLEKEEKIKTDSILIFRGISDTVKRKGFETEHEEKELLWISKIWLLSYM